MWIIECVAPTVAQQACQAHPKQKLVASMQRIVQSLLISTCEISEVIAVDGWQVL